MSKHYVEILQEIERVVLGKCNGHRKRHNLSSLAFSENCEVEKCSIDCPLLSLF